MKLFLALLLAWLPQGHPFAGASSDGCDVLELWGLPSADNPIDPALCTGTVGQAGYTCRCQMQTPLTWLWDLDGDGDTEVAAHDDFRLPHERFRLGQIVHCRVRVDAGGWTTCPRQYTFVMDRAWWRSHNRYAGRRPAFCSVFRPLIFADDFESGGTTEWSRSVP